MATMGGPATEKPHLTFSDFQFSIDVSFWEQLRQLKLTEWRLDEPSAPMRGVIRVNTSGRVFLTPPNLVHLGSHSFTSAPPTPGQQEARAEIVDAQVAGLVKPYNFAEGLNTLDSRNALFSLAASLFLRPALAAYSTPDTAEDAWAQIPFCTLCMFVYIDAKAYRFYHKEAMPSVAVEGPLVITAVTRGVVDQALFSSSTAQTIYHHGTQLLRDFPARTCNPFFAICAAGEAPSFCALSPHPLAAHVDDTTTVVLCLFDFSDAAGSLCLPARSIIACLRLAVPSLTSLTVYALRAGGPEKSILFNLSFDAIDTTRVAALRARLADASPADMQLIQWKDEFPFLKVSGWRKKRVESLDLGAFINPVQRADSDSRFNLELMKWRVLPSLELGRLAECKALLLGTGTLGCNVARNLLMWGVRHFTLVDRGNVSFSNLARQSLFSFDAAREGRSKVDAASDALRSIIPTVVAHPVPLTIHMPGHRIDETKTTEALGEIHRLEELIAESDVVFLLTDSREARWMPTIIAAASGTPVVNVALGFDTYVVMRHGVSAAAVSRSNVAPTPADTTRTETALGCYFCSDVVAPTDSLSFRALDEQCTVTRPAVSSIASALAVELVAELYQHPDGFRCPAYRESATSDDEAGRCRLGVIPQQIRGSVFSHTMHHLCGERNPFCTACSDKLLQAYHEGGAEFLLRCVNAPQFIEEVCGVKELKEKWEAADQEMCWSSDDEWADS